MRLCGVPITKGSEHRSSSQLRRSNHVATRCGMAPVRFCLSKVTSSSCCVAIKARNPARPPPLSPPPTHPQRRRSGMTTMISRSHEICTGQDGKALTGPIFIFIFGSKMSRRISQRPDKNASPYFFLIYN